MIDKPVCIRRVNTLEEAQLLVAWLDEYEIDAIVMGAQNPGSLAFGVSDFEGIGVFVLQDCGERDRNAAESSLSGGSDIATPEARTPVPVSTSEQARSNSRGEMRCPVMK